MGVGWTVGTGGGVLVGVGIVGVGVAGLGVGSASSSRRVKFVPLRMLDGKQSQPFMSCRPEDSA